MEAVYPSLVRAYRSYFERVGVEGVVQYLMEIGVITAVLGIVTLPLSLSPILVICFPFFYLGLVIYFRVRIWLLRGVVLRDTPSAEQTSDSDDVFR